MSRIPFALSKAHFARNVPGFSQESANKDTAASKPPAKAPVSLRPPASPKLTKSSPPGSHVKHLMTARRRRTAVLTTGSSKDNSQQIYKEIVLHLLAENRHKNVMINKMLRDYKNLVNGKEAQHNTPINVLKAQLYELMQKCPAQVVHAVQQGHFSEFMEGDWAREAILKDVQPSPVGEIESGLKKLTANLLLENKALESRARSSTIDQENEAAFSQNFQLFSGSQKDKGCAAFRRNTSKPAAPAATRFMLSPSEIFSPDTVKKINEGAEVDRKLLAFKKKLKTLVGQARVALDEARSVGSGGKTFGKLEGILGQMDSELGMNPPAKNEASGRGEGSKKGDEGKALMARERKKRKSCDDMLY